MEQFWFLITLDGKERDGGIKDREWPAQGK